MATTSRVTPWGWEQGDDSADSSRVTPGGWEQVVGAGGGVTGTVAATNANDTSAASGTTTVTGTLAKSNGGDTSAASGTTTIVGASSAANADDTSAASGSVGSSGSTGTLATTNANDSAAASGTTTATGAVARANGSDAVIASGWVGLISGTVANSNANDTAAAQGIGPAQAQQAFGGGGIYPTPRRKTKQEIDEDRKRLGILPDEPDVQTGIVEVPRKKITLSQLIGKTAAAQVNSVDLSIAVEANRRIKRRRDDEFLLMM